MGTLRTSEIFSAPMLTLIAVESVDFRYSKTNTYCHLYGKIKTIAVIVCSPDGIYTLDIDAKPANIDQLRKDIPELDAIVAPMIKTP